MVSQKMLALGRNSSVIRDIAEFGQQRAAQIGAENVFDFSIGNPSVPAPQAVTDTMKALLENGYNKHLRLLQEQPL